MESKLKCGAQDCNQQASYMYRGTAIYICEEHFQPSQKEHLVKIGNVDGAQETLDVVKKCIINFKLELEQEEYQNIQEESKVLVNNIQSKIPEISKELDSPIESNPTEKYESIEYQVRAIVTEVKSSQPFRSFCFKNYMNLMCDYLEIDRSKIARFISIDSFEGAQDSEISRIKTELEETKSKYTQFRQRAISKMECSNKDDLKKIYEIVTNKQILEKWNDQVGLDCKSKQDVEFMEAIKCQILPNLNDFRIDKIDLNLLFAKEFILSSFPQKVLRFHLNWEGEIIDIESMNEIIMYINLRIAEELHLYNFQIDQFQLKILLQAVCRNKISLGLSDCALKFDSVPNLQYCFERSKINFIYLNYCGSPERCDWGNHPERFSNLIEALGQSEEMKQQLKTIYLSECKMPKESVRETLDKFCFDSVEIGNYSF
ncbi:unnamed protein product [Moneuplotes crassus]|uniref:Uncharacterized protein n=1 Tax=Euplotes crassus TaxID=5936 RepID=A0AAD1TZT7_EUPCR|nr:unnamed protein product [Moneuplotes crassus]